MRERREKEKEGRKRKEEESSFLPFGWLDILIKRKKERKKEREREKDKIKSGFEMSPGRERVIESLSLLPLSLSHFFSLIIGWVRAKGSEREREREEKVFVTQFIVHLIVERKRIINERRKEKQRERERERVINTLPLICLIAFPWKWKQKG